MEAPVGAYALDLLATESATSRQVAIENQLEATNHDHLGKLLTYASGYNPAFPRSTGRAELEYD